MALNRADVLFIRGRDILREEGVIPFIKRVSSFLVRPLFRYQTCYLYEKSLDRTSEVEFTPKIQNFTLKIISTTEQVAKLIDEGFDISSYSKVNRGIDNLHKRLATGAICFCIFIKQDLAHISWLAMSDKAKGVLDSLPHSMDYQREAWIGYSITHPKWRRLGIYTYAYSEMFQFLKRKGVSKAKFAVIANDIPPQKAQVKLGSTICGTWTLLKVLLWEFWKEKPVASR